MSAAVIRPDVTAAAVIVALDARDPAFALAINEDVISRFLEEFSKWPGGPGIFALMESVPPYLRRLIEGGAAV